MRGSESADAQPMMIDASNHTSLCSLTWQTANRPGLLDGIKRHPEGLRRSSKRLSPKMRLLQFTVAALGLVNGVLSQSSTADAYVASESPIAKAGLLANIGPSGSKSQGAKVRVSRTLSHPIALTCFCHSLVRHSHCQPQHLQPRLPLHMDARLLTRVQGYHRSVYLQQRHHSSQPDRQLCRCADHHPAGIQPEWHRLFGWSWGA